jgi:NADPH-dependent glutamate synthase beta subunit-like oxidoreductase
VGIDIPGFIAALQHRDFKESYRILKSSNALPAVCGRVCPQESQCEAYCVVGDHLEPVAIGRLERFVGDHGHAGANGNGKALEAVQAASAPKLGKVAIVGSGPAGLACAGDRARNGADVTVYEALHVVGGVLRYGIPSFRLPRDIIEREVARLSDIGVRFETNKVVGKTFTIAQLTGTMGFDAVFIAAGAGAPAFLGIPGESAGQVFSANEFLTRVNLMGGDQFPYRDTPIGLGDDVVVIGAGNTAMDCLRVARRLGASRVRCVYRRSEAEAPARVEELRHARE